MPSPRPTSTAVKILKGNPGKRRLNLDEPQLPPPDTSFDTPPDELAANPLASAEWSRLAPILREARQVTATDRTALIALCLEWARYLHATQKLTEQELILQTHTGYDYQNPYLSIAGKALANCHRLWPELGLTPSSRSRIRATPEPAASDPFAEFDTMPTPTGPRAVK